MPRDYTAASAASRAIPAISLLSATTGLRAATTTDEPNGRFRVRRILRSMRQSRRRRAAMRGETSGRLTTSAGRRESARETAVRIRLARRSDTKAGKTEANAYVDRRGSRPASRTASTARVRVYRRWCPFSSSKSLQAHVYAGTDMSRRPPGARTRANSLSARRSGSQCSNTSKAATISNMPSEKGNARADPQTPPGASPRGSMSRLVWRPNLRSQPTLGPSALPTSRTRSGLPMNGWRIASNSSALAVYHQYSGLPIDAEPPWYVDARMTTH